MALRDYLVGEIAEDAVDGRISRREALRRLGLMGVSLPAATALLAACAGDDGGGAASTTTTSTTVAPLAADETIRFAGPAGELRGAFAAPEEPTAAVLVLHENRGLTPHFVDLVGRFAREGMAALCVDLVSTAGGTDSMAEGDVQATLAAAPLEALLADVRAGIDELQRRAPEAPVAVVGFCFGGAMTWNLLDAGDDRVVAAVPFYGPAPDAPDFAGVRAAVLAIYAGKDDRVNASQARAVAALTAASIVHEVKVFDGADHAFFNDTGQRYEPIAAAEAWELTLNWIVDHT